MWLNVSDLVILKAVFAAAHELNVPITVGASKGERNFIGVREIATLVQALPDEFVSRFFSMSSTTTSSRRR